MKITYNNLGYVLGNYKKTKIEIIHKQDFFWYVYISDKYMGKMPYSYKETNGQAFKRVIKYLFA